MTTETLTRTPAVTLADVEAIAKDDPSWLREKRLEAWRLYESMDFPDVYDEEWRRTDVRAIDLSEYRTGASRARELEARGAAKTSEAHARGEEPPLKLRLGGRWHWSGMGDSAVFIGGDNSFLPQTYDDLRDNGVVVLPLWKAVRSHENLLRDKLYGAVEMDEWKYLALNAALWSSGAFVFVPKDVEVSIPLHLVWGDVADDAERPSAEAILQRTVIVAERNSRVAIIDESSSSDPPPPAFVSGAVEIFVGDGAKVEYYAVNGWSKNVYNFNTVRAILGRDAEFVGTAAGIGSKLTKMRFDVEMPQPGARTELLGVTFGNGDQHFDYNTVQNHTGNHTTSDLQFKSALTDSASLVWYGITRINETAGGSEANQTSRNLLLSEHAKAAPIPILEIKAHDVSKCSHGATAGPVEESELFYLESRAIPRATAEQMLVQGYFADVVDRIPNVQVRERIMDAVLAKMGGGIESLSYDELMSA